MTYKIKEEELCFHCGLPSSQCTFGDNSPYGVKK